MLKKWVSLCLLFVMLMPVAVFAEEVTAFIHETDPYYTYVAPEGWMLISEDNLDAILQLGGNLINDDQIMAYIEQAKAADMAMFMAPNMSDNINITYQYLGQEGTAEELAMYLAPALVEQFKSMFADMEVENEGSVITLGDHAFMTLSYLYTLMGSQMHVAQYMIVQDGTLYTFTYTSSEKDEAEIQLIEESLASFSTTK